MAQLAEWHAAGRLDSLPDPIPGFADELAQYADRGRLIGMVRAIPDAVPWSLTAYERAGQIVTVLTPLIEGGGCVTREECSMPNNDPQMFTGPLTDVQLAANEFTPESGEAAYRRGYQDGWLTASDILHDLITKNVMTPDEAFTVCEDHFYDGLAEWRGTDTNRLVLPPDPPMPHGAEEHAP